MFSCRFLGVSTRSFQAPSQSQLLRLRQGLPQTLQTATTRSTTRTGSRSPAARFAELATSPISSALEVIFPPRSSLIRLRVLEAREDVVCLKPSATCRAACGAVSASDDVGPVLAALSGPWPKARWQRWTIAPRPGAGNPRSPEAMRMMIEMGRRSAREKVSGPWLFFVLL